MNRKRKQKIEKELQKLYAQVPNANCKGLCQSACSAIGLSLGEAEILREATGEVIAIDGEGKCNFLIEGKCSVYNKRPMLCRLFGSTEKMPCPFGCKPLHVLNETHSRFLLKRAEAIGGGIVFSQVPSELLPKSIDILGKVDNLSTITCNGCGGSGFDPMGRLDEESLDLCLICDGKGVITEGENNAKISETTSNNHS